MSELSAAETSLLLLASFTGYVIVLSVLIRNLDRWTRRLADWIVSRRERREKSLTKPSLDG